MIEVTFLLLITLAAHLIEADYEAANGDKTHWKSLVIMFVFVGMVGWGLSLAWWQSCLAVVAVRAWFDLMYNYFAGHRWDYLGQWALTDELLEDIDPEFILVARFSISISALLIMFRIPLF